MVSITYFPIEPVPPRPPDGRRGRYRSGPVAGNLALTFGARGGIYIAGGIAPKTKNTFAASRFRQRFEAKGRFRDYLAQVPTSIVMHPEPAFLGLMRVLRGTASRS